jgi:hypothetical protein
MPRILLLLALVGLIVPPILAVRLKQQRPHLGDEVSDELDFVAIFEGRELRSTAPAFRGGRVTCWYGGGELDLTGVRPDPAGVHLDATCVFGGLSIRVPSDWRVTVHSIGLFGGIGDSRPGSAPPADDAPTLVIDAFSAFGGIGIEGPREPAPAGANAPASGARA